MLRILRAQARELETRTMHVFISRALQKVLKECPKKHTQLRQSCAAVIEELKDILGPRGDFLASILRFNAFMDQNGDAEREGEEV